MRSRLMFATAWVLAVVLTAVTIATLVVERFGYDSHAYWMAWHGPMYSAAPGTVDAYLYSPAFAQLMWPLAQLPWPIFAAAYALVLLAALAWLLKPLHRRWWLPLGIAGLNEVIAGNVYLLLAVMVVVGFTVPETWAFAAVTKVTTFVGPIWFGFRGEWVNMVRALGAMVIVAAVSFSIAADDWRQWISFLWAHLGQTTGSPGAIAAPPLILRLPLGLGLLVWGALTRRRWAVPASMVLTTPVLGFASFFVLLALPRMGYPPTRRPPVTNETKSTMRRLASSPPSGMPATDRDGEYPAEPSDAAPPGAQRCSARTARNARETM